MNEVLQSPEGKLESPVTIRCERPSRIFRQQPAMAAQAKESTVQGGAINGCTVGAKPLGERRQKQRGENGDDRDHDQQFNQREGGAC